MSPAEDEPSPKLSPPISDRSSARGLGRGLGALIPRGEPGLQELELGQITPNPRQPRLRIDEESLSELADSIRQHGLIQPVVVTRSTEESDRYVLLAGERRWRAAQRAGLRAIPAVVKESAPAQQLELALIENIQREDLAPLETAAAYRTLADEYGLTQEQLAQRVGKSRAAVANTLRLLQLPQQARDALANARISEGHARALLGAPSDAVEACLAEVLEQGLTVRETEELVRRASSRSAEPERDPASGETRPDSSRDRAQKTDPELAHLEERFRQALGTKVQLVRARKGGRVIIHFYSDEELAGIYEAICE